MPLTAKGSEIKANMEKTYGAKKGEQVFYASKNAGKISGVDSTGSSAADSSKAYMDSAREFGPPLTRKR